MKTMMEILDETLNYYVGHPERRAIGDTKPGCYYLSPNGQMCAVGRCCIDPKNGDTEDKYNLWSFSLTQDRYWSNAILNDHLKEEYRGHPINFWIKLQQLHDCNHYWNLEGQLTPIGEASVQDLKDFIERT